MKCADCGHPITDDLSVRRTKRRLDGTLPEYGLHLNCGRDAAPHIAAAKAKLPTLDETERK